MMAATAAAKSESAFSTAPFTAPASGIRCFCPEIVGVFGSDTAHSMAHGYKSTVSLCFAPKQGVLKGFLIR